MHVNRYRVYSNIGELKLFVIRAVKGNNVFTPLTLGTDFYWWYRSLVYSLITVLLLAPIPLHEKGIVLRECILTFRISYFDPEITKKEHHKTYYLMCTVTSSPITLLKSLHLTLEIQLSKVYPIIFVRLPFSVSFHRLIFRSD